MEPQSFLGDGGNKAQMRVVLCPDVTFSGDREDFFRRLFLYLRMRS
jgi:hypothetical protein